MKLEFKASDFDSAISDEDLENLPFFNEDSPDAPSLAKRYAKIANTRLREMLAEAPRIYRRPGYGWSLRRLANSTEIARLVCIERLPNP
jgi:hypothetical protein